MMRKPASSFNHAFFGLRWIFKTQPNFRIHFLLSALSIFGGWYFKISYGEFLTILVLITVGLVVESINTAIEETIDAIHKDWSEAIKLAKDVSAASMLIFAIGSIIVASVIFVPKILERFYF
ncbi:diacylglycerol kinase family protein [Candidatus Roizmanbacteria bacterium]|nr:diacylglycerol kinase family protein [Candidatus Roizmanbacteria bacterium]